MMIMPGNNQSAICHYLSGKYPGKIGLLFSPDGWRTPPFYMPYAIDNGAFINWDEDNFFFTLRKAKMLKRDPLWVVCPDVVGDAEKTIEQWHKYSKKIDFPLAFACQDGMEPQDVPQEAFCCFIGGSTDFKLNHADKFKGIAPWLHVGRVNSLSRMEWAKNIGADSIDGTGFFRARDKKYYDFIRWFEGDPQLKLPMTP